MRGAVLSVLCAAFGLFGGTTFGAGGLGGGNNNFGGSFFPFGSSVYPEFGSSSSSGDGSASGSFWMRLDPNVVSFEYANWSFHTYSWDTSRWTATCMLHGLRDSSESWPQNQSWSQSMDAKGLSLYASLNMSCYEWPSSQDIANLQTQLLQLQLQLLTAPEDKKAELTAQISSLQNYLAYLLDQPKRQTLSLDGCFSVAPAALDGSGFRYWETTDNYYSWPKGWDHDPVITLIPSWSAEYNAYGHFLAPTLAEAQAMGAPYAQHAPEPGTIVMIFSGAAAVGLMWWRRKRQ
jgi:hypothetical protein